MHANVFDDAQSWLPGLHYYDAVRPPFEQDSLPSNYLKQKMKFDNEIATVLGARKPDTDMLNLVEVLGYGPDKFQDAFDIALEMDNRDLVKLLYSNFNAGKVIVEFTLLGKNARYKST